MFCSNARTVPMAELLVVPWHRSTCEDEGMLLPPPFNCTISQSPPCHLGCHCSNSKLDPGRPGLKSCCFNLLTDAGFWENSHGQPFQELLTPACPVLLCFPAVLIRPNLLLLKHISAQMWTFQHVITFPILTRTPPT